MPRRKPVTARADRAAGLVPPVLRTGARFEIALLGQPRFCYDGEAFVFPAFRKTLQLLAYLQMRSGPADRDALAFLFWPDDEEETALANLRRNLHLLNTHLPPCAPRAAWIVAEGSTLVWNARCDTPLDVRSFEEALKAGRPTEAVALYRGDLLESLYDEWIVPERERLRRRFDEAVLTLIGAHRSRREFAIALEYASRLLAIDPLREDLARVAIAMRYESGDRAGAMREFRAFATRLREEMDVDPMPETVALRDAILSDADVGATTLGSGVAVARRQAYGANAPSSQGPVLPFIGRAEEFARLRERYERAVAGDGGAIAVCGEAGIGKTRLVTELVRLAEAQGTRVLAGTTTSPEAMPYQALVTALRPMVPMLTTSRIAPVWLAALAPLLPGLAARPASPAIGAHAPERLRSEEGDRRESARLAEAFALAFEELARARPLLVVLEDVHWSGAATIDALDALRERLGRRRVLFVVTYREDERGATSPLRVLRRGPEPIETIPLARLPVSAIDELAASPGIAARLSREELQRFYDRAEGHPLFWLDLIAHPGDTKNLPPAIEDAIARRLENVEPAAQVYLEIAATAGAAFDLDTVVAVAGGSEREAEGALASLVQRNTLRRASRRGGSDFAFTHHLIHRVAYDRIDALARGRFHRRIADFVSERDGVRSASAALIGYHYAAGGENERAAEAYSSAAARAERAAAAEEAIDFAERGLALTTSASLTTPLLFLLERLIARRADRDRHAAVLARLRADVEAGGSPEDRGALIVREMVDAQSRDDREATARILASLDRHAERHADPASAAVAARVRAESMRQDRIEESITFGRQALAYYRDVGDTAGAVEMLCLIARAASVLGRTGEARSVVAEARMLSRQDNVPALEARVLLAAALVATNFQQYAECADLATRSARLFVDAGDLDGEATALNLAGGVFARLLRFDEAEAAYTRTQYLYAVLRSPRRIAGSLINASLVTVGQHRYAEAVLALERARALFGDAGDPRGVAVCEVNLSYAFLQLERPQEALAAARESLAIVRDLALGSIEISSVLNVGSALYESGHTAEARPYFEEAIRIASDRQRPVDRCDATIYLILTLLEAGPSRELATAVADLQGAMESLTVMEPYLAHWAIARGWHALGDARAAGASLRLADAAAAARDADARDDESRATAGRRRFVRELRATVRDGVWP